MKIEKLKPCPFCGGEAYIESLNDHRTGYAVHFATCLVCGCEMPRIARTKQKAAEVWNRRTENDEKKGL